MLYGLTSAVIIPDRQGKSSVRTGVQNARTRTPRAQLYIHVLYSTNWKIWGKWGRKGSMWGGGGQPGKEKDCVFLTQILEQSAWSDVTLSKILVGLLFTSCPVKNVSMVLFSSMDAKPQSHAVSDTVAMHTRSHVQQRRRTYSISTAFQSSLFVFIPAVLTLQTRSDVQNLQVSAVSATPD